MATMRGIADSMMFGGVPPSASDTASDCQRHVYTYGERAARGRARTRGGAAGCSCSRCPHAQAPSVQHRHAPGYGRRRMAQAKENRPPGSTSTKEAEGRSTSCTTAACDRSRAAAYGSSRCILFRFWRRRSLRICHTAASFSSFSYIDIAGQLERVAQLHANGDLNGQLERVACCRPADRATVCRSVEPCVGGRAPRAQRCACQSSNSLPIAHDA